MPRKKKTKSSVRMRRAALFIFSFAVVATAVLLVTNALRSPRGKLVFLDAGFGGRYEIVQDEIDAELDAAIRRLGLEKRLRETTTPVSVGKREFRRREWVVDLPRSESLIRVNLALTEAVQRAGGIVRSSREDPEGNVTLRVGSRRYTTHVVKISRGAGVSHEAPSGERNVGTAESADAVRRPRIALVIDDFGYSRDESVEKFLAVDFPITVSVIPELPYSKYAVERAVDGGKQAMLHLPMEAEAFASEVPAVLTSMSGEEIKVLVEKYLRETEGVVGVNNHLGSVATRDERVMETVLSVLKPRKLFFLDSLTTNKSVAYTTARTLGVPTARNDLFIDADTEDGTIIGTRLDHLIEIAASRGHAIGIGHPRPWTYEAVSAFEARVREAGVELVFLSEIVE